MPTNPEDPSVESRTSDPTVGSLPAGLFSAWQRTVSDIVSLFMRIGPGARALARTWARQWPLVRAYHTDAALPWNADGDAARRVAAALGLRSFIVGLIVTGLGIATATSLWLPVAVGVGSQVLWAGARFMILALLMPPGTISRTRLSTAFLAGLLPYAFAATWLLQLAALGVSAVLTQRGLIGARVPRPDARIAVAWAFGGQVAITVGGWALRALVVLFAG